MLRASLNKSLSCVIVNKKGWVYVYESPAFSVIPIGKATEDNAQYQVEDRGDYRKQEYGTYPDFLTSSFKQLDVLVSVSFSVDMGRNSRPS